MAKRASRSRAKIHAMLHPCWEARNAAPWTPPRARYRTLGRSHAGDGGRPAGELPRQPADQPVRERGLGRRALRGRDRRVLVLRGRHEARLQRCDALLQLRHAAPDARQLARGALELAVGLCQRGALGGHDLPRFMPASRGVLYCLLEASPHGMQTQYI